MDQGTTCRECGRLISGPSILGWCQHCFADVKDDGEDLANLKGQQLGSYRILDKLGQGKMGVVFKALQTDLGDRLVALKVLSRTNVLDVARFEQEVHAQARIEHPNIVRIYGSGHERGYHFFSMEYLRGDTLNKRLSRLRSDRRRAVETVLKISRAVAKIHEHKIIHRDIKMTNVIFDEQEEPHVSDFGVARLLHSSLELTSTGVTLGTPLYLAPERLEGKAATEGSDVWSLGVILYCLLAGKYPFQAENDHALRHLILTEDPARPKDVPTDLWAICEKSLEKEPSERYATAEGLALDCQRWLSGEVTDARPAGYLRRLVKLGRRHPLKVLAGVTTFAFVGPVIVAAVYVLFVNYLRGSHRVHYFDRQGELELMAADFNGGKNLRITESFEAEPFTGGANLLLRVDGVPQDLLDELNFVVRSDWAGLPDRRIAGPLQHNQTVTVSRRDGKLLADVFFYFTKESWPETLRQKVPPGLKLTVKRLPKS